MMMALALAVRAAVAHARAPDLDRPDPGLDRSLRCMAMADQAATPCRVDLIGMHREESRHLGLDRQAQHLPRPFTKHREQGIVLDRPTNAVSESSNWRAWR
jgi:hypothetical protein